MKSFLFLFTLFIVFKPVFPIVEYIVFYDYISTELCENRDEPELECNGTCHLKKELSKVADSENPISTEKNNRPLIEFSHLFFVDFKAFNLTILYETTTQEHLVYQNLYSLLITDSIFHPPVIF